MFSKSPHQPRLQEKNPKSIKMYHAAFSLPCFSPVHFLQVKLPRHLKLHLQWASCLQLVLLSFTHLFEDKNCYFCLIKSIITSSKTTIQLWVCESGIALRECHRVRSYRKLYHCLKLCNHLRTGKQSASTFLDFFFPPYHSLHIAQTCSKNCYNQNKKKKRKEMRGNMK